jgi:hypothetical protein
MRRNSLLSAHGLGSKVFTAIVALWCLGLVVPVFAQDPVQTAAALPDAPSTPQQQFVPTTQPPKPSLTFGKRAHLYAHEVFGPETIIGPAFGAGIGQWEDEPPGWHEGGEGYGKRFGSGVARHTIAETIRFGIAAADGEDPRCLPSEDRSFWGRTRHAIVSTFVSQRSSGTRMPAFSRLLGTYGAAFISNTWYPDNRATGGDAARRGSTALAASVGFRLVREFVPVFRALHE